MVEYDEFGMVGMEMNRKEKGELDGQNGLEWNRKEKSGMTLDHKIMTFEQRERASSRRRRWISDDTSDDNSNCE